MKKIISLLLSVFIIIFLFSLQMFTTNAEESTENNTLKNEISQKYYEIYGENGIIDEEREYTWDYSEVEETIHGISSNPNISPYWASKEAGNPDEKVTHDDIIDTANNMAIEDGGDVIPVLYLPLVKFINKRCDTSRNDTTGNLAQYNSKVIHGQDNYYATIYYLWTFAKSIKNYESGSITDAVQAANQEGRSVLPAKIKENEYYIKLFNFTKKIVKEYYNDTGVYYNKNQSYGRRCKYIVYGIICHTLGDIYAHRTIVPRRTVKTILEKPTITYDSDDEQIVKWYFNPDHFADLKRSRLNEMINIVSTVDDDGNSFETSVCFSEIKSYCELAKIAGDKMNDTEEDLLEDIKDTIGSQYVDNGKFYPGRVNEAVFAVNFFIENFTCCDAETVYFSIDPTTFTLKNFETYAGEIATL